MVCWKSMCCLIFFYQQGHVYTVLFSFSFLFQWLFVFWLKKALLVFLGVPVHRKSLCWPIWPSGEEASWCVDGGFESLLRSTFCGEKLCLWTVCMCSINFPPQSVKRQTGWRPSPFTAGHLVVTVQNPSPLAFCILSVPLRLGHGTARETKLRN